MFFNNENKNMYPESFSHLLNILVAWTHLFRDRGSKSSFPVACEGEWKKENFNNYLCGMSFDLYIIRFLQAYRMSLIFIELMYCYLYCVLMYLHSLVFQVSWDSSCQKGAFPLWWHVQGSDSPVIGSKASSFFGRSLPKKSLLKSFLA